MSNFHDFITVLLQNGANLHIRNTDGRTALDLADSSAKTLLTGQLILDLFHRFVAECEPKWGEKMKYSSMLSEIMWSFFW